MNAGHIIFSNSMKLLFSRELNEAPDSITNFNICFLNFFASSTEHRARYESNEAEGSTRHCLLGVLPGVRFLDVEGVDVVDPRFLPGDSISSFSLMVETIATASSGIKHFA